MVKEVPFEWVFDALGGGPAAFWTAIAFFLAVTIYWGQRSRISELQAENKEMRSALTRLTDVVESWMPEAQGKKLRRP
jgi:hypothetical protein